MRRHVLNKHGIIYTDEKSHESKITCHLDNCSEKFFTKTLFINHLKKKHDVIVPTENKTFDTMKEFLVWKEQEELRNFVFFSQQSGDHKSATASQRYYYCQHDGSALPHRSKSEPGRTTKRKNKKGQVKTGSFCPAKMTLKISEPSGKVQLEYTKSHNHPINITNTVFQPVPKSLQTQIAAKVAVGKPVNEIHREVRGDMGDRENRESVSGNVTRAHLLKKRVISDIKRRLEKGKRLHPDDSTSVLMLVEKLKSEKFNPIVVYKPQGEKTIIGPKMYDDIDLKNDLFVIGIQTKEQLKIMEEHGTKIICVDSTHKTNQYDFPLINFVVPDEFNKGYPVAHLISNKSDELTQRPFLAAIKERCSSEFQPNVVMTDDDNTSFNAFRNVFGSNIHFLCKWHVKRAWKNKLPLVGGAQEDVYQALDLLIEERDVETFHRLLDGFEQQYSKLHPTFMEYFVKTYVGRVEKWAMCYRDFEHAATDTNMFVEAFHNRLKTHYMDRRPNKRYTL